MYENIFFGIRLRAYDMLFHISLQARRVQISHHCTYVLDHNALIERVRAIIRFYDGRIAGVRGGEGYLPAGSEVVACGYDTRVGVGAEIVVGEEVGSALEARCYC